MTSPVVLDFETLGIEQRPNYPPVPVGVAIKYPGQPSYYWSWAHPTGNNTSLIEAHHVLSNVWNSGLPILCHNAKYDLDVACTHFNLPMPKWQHLHDTLFLLFLQDPHAQSLSLKPSAERLLGLPPTEQEEVRDWLLEHQPVKGVHIGQGRTSKEPWGKYICMAPGDLVGRYACGDVDRTLALYDHLQGYTGDAYDRERRLLPILLEMERRGIRVDVQALESDLTLYTDVMREVSLHILRVTGSFCNLDSGAELIKALDKVGKVDRRLLPKTDTGKESTSKDALEAAVTDKPLLHLLRYRAHLKTCLNTFIEPWHRMAESTGRIYTTWHQTRGEDGGTRTGRLSSSPNFQNIPKVFRALFDHEAPGRGLPRAPIELPPLPRMRRYIVPDEGQVLLNRDYSQQELRILAHYEDGAMQAKYTENPRLDAHDMARTMINAKSGRNYERGPIKTLGFGLLYGMGIQKLSDATGLPYEEAKELKEAYLTTFPEVGDLMRDLKFTAKMGQAIKTWGGRPYHVEPQRIVDGVVRDYFYKLLNVLIQGSAADCTKEAICRYHESGASWPMLLSVHDELMTESPMGEINAAMRELKTAMESVEFDVPMLTDGKMSKRSWADLTKWDEEA